VYGALSVLYQKSTETSMEQVLCMYEHGTNSINIIKKGVWKRSCEYWSVIMMYCKNGGPYYPEVL